MYIVLTYTAKSIFGILFYLSINNDNGKKAIAEMTAYEIAKI
jgi:hypothetical protein